MGSLCIKSDDISKEKKQRLKIYSKNINKSNYDMSKSGDIRSLIRDQWHQELTFNKNIIQLVDLDKFGHMYANYSHEQGYYQIIWDGVDIVQPEENKYQKYERNQNDSLIFHWKYIIRRGVPLNKTRNLLLNLIKTNWKEEKTEYLIRKKKIFEGKSDTNMVTVPTFQKEIQVQNILTHQCLTQQGIEAMNRILWVIKENFYQLQYNPLIVQTIQFLMIFLDEIETYIIIRHLLSDSIDVLDNKSQQNSDLVRELRWHFSVTQEEFIQQTKVFFDLVQARISEFKKILDHFKKINFAFKNIFQKWVSNIFFGYLRFNTILRIMTLYMNEGIRVFIKISYGICMLLQQQILSCNSAEKMELIFKNMKIDTDIEQTDQLFQMAYTLKIKKAPNALNKYQISQEISGHFNVRDRLLYRPKIDQPSQIISYIQFEEIWEELPKQNKLSNPKLIFSTKLNGYSLQTLYSTLSQQDINKPILIFIKTESSVMGAFSPQNIDMKQKYYYGTEKCFVFSLEPRLKFYKPTHNKNQDYLCSNYNFLCWGSDCPAIQINSDLNGYTNESKTYMNPLLNNKKTDTTFTCLMLEVFMLDF